MKAIDLMERDMASSTLQFEINAVPLQILNVGIFRVSGFGLTNLPTEA